jgi:integrase
MLIALFSGMRQGEICQLQTDDIQRRGNVWVFTVTGDGAGQSLKTNAAARIVPVHSALIRCGLTNYLRALPSGQLFPALKPGGPDGKLNWYLTKRFTAYRRECGIEGPRLAFHSFRKNTAQALKNARTTPAEIAELIGHERGFTVETYAPLSLPVSQLKSLIERIKYPGLILKPLYVG